MIVLQFTRGSDFGADAITWFTHGADFSHVDAVLPEGLLGARSDRVGGAAEGVQIRSPHYTENSKRLRVELAATPEMTQSFVRFIKGQLGKPYDSTGIAAFIFGRTWQAPDSWFCSELMGAALQKCGWFEHPLVAASNKIAPADLLLAISAKAPVDLSRTVIPPAKPTHQPESTG